MSLWQTPSWQQMLQKSGQVDAFFEVDGIFVEKRRISFGQYGLFVTGVEIDISPDTSLKIQKLCKDEKCLFVQYETYSYDETTYTIPHTTEGYYKKFIPPFTCVINLEKSEEDILAAMKQKGRYNIRLAEKKGVTIEQVEKNPYNADIFHKIISETTARNAFAGNTSQYYEIFLKKLTDSQLFFAYHEEQVIAAGIFVVSGKRMMYYYGASANAQRNLMAPYLLQWKAIEHAKQRGCTLYDFLGVAGPEEQNSSLAGVTDFKMKLSPDRREVSQGYIWIRNTPLYYIIQCIKKTLRK